MTTAELVKELRDWRKYGDETVAIAADRLESQAALIASLTERLAACSAILSRLAERGVAVPAEAAEAARGGGK